MRVVVPLSAVLLAACAPKTPLDLIPRADLLMIEAAERMEQQAPQAVRAPQPVDLDAQYAAALVAAGISPMELQAAGQAAQPDAAMPPLPPRRPDAVAAVTAPAPTPVAPTPTAPPGPAPASPTAVRPISVDEMLARVRAQTAPKP